MDRYHIALFIHIVALLAACAASALVHYSFTRRSASTSLSEARQWHAFASSTARVFPIAVVTLFITGATMIGAGGALAWGAGWIDAGITGSVLLMGIGAVIGRRSGVLRRELDRLAGIADGSLPRAILHDPVTAGLLWANTGMALMIVLVMVIKPGRLESLVALAIGVAGGFLIGTRPVREKASSVGAATG